MPSAVETPSRSSPGVTWVYVAAISIDEQRPWPEFERAQKVEERFHTEFDGLDFTKSVAVGLKAFFCDSSRFRALLHRLLAACQDRKDGASISPLEPLRPSTRTRACRGSQAKSQKGPKGG